MTSSALPESLQDCEIYGGYHKSITMRCPHFASIMQTNKLRVETPPLYGTRLLSSNLIDPSASLVTAPVTVPGALTVPHRGHDMAELETTDLSNRPTDHLTPKRSFVATHCSKAKTHQSLMDRSKTSYLRYDN